MRLLCTFSVAALAVGIACPIAAFGADEAAAPAAAATKQKVEQRDPKMDAEVAFINALVEANMPDLAEPVIAAAKKQWPMLGPKLKVIEQQGKLRLGKFEEVQKVIDATQKGSGEYWGLRLAMADAFYARGKTPECAQIYREFFKAVPNPGPDLRSFYVEAGFKWAQMCILEKKFHEAVAVYRGLLKQQLPEEHWCAIATDDVELLIRLASEMEDPKDAKKREAYLKEASDLCDKLLWKNELIVFFGRAVSLKAHIEMLRGKVDKADELVNEYMPQLKDIHQALADQDADGTKGLLRMSPMPGCRYLLAKMKWEKIQEELKKPSPDKGLVNDLLLGVKVGNKRNGLGAFNHAVNVYLKYPESSWAAAAGDMVDEINKVVKEKYGKDLKASMKIPADQMKKVRAMQFKNAHDAFRGGDNEAAVKAYLAVLSQMPEQDESVISVGNLAQAYLNLWNSTRDKNEKENFRLNADAVEGYLAERFSGLKPELARAGGDVTLQLAAKEQELGARARATEVYALYFKHYPDHYQAAQTAMSLAGQAWKQEDWEGAMRWYGAVANGLTNSAFYANSLQMLSLCCGKLGDAAGEVEWLRKYAGAVKRPVDRAAAQLTLAQLQQRNGFEQFKSADKAAETNAPAEAVEAMKKAAASDVLRSFKDFTAVAKLAGEEMESKMTGKKDKAKFDKQRELALFLAGDSMQRLAYPEANVPKFRAVAVKTYDKYLELYPKAKRAPQTLVRIGTVWTAEKNAEKSKAAFDRLAKEFPDSDEAKNSMPRLAKTLIDMGLKQEGVDIYSQMLRTSGNYTASQFLQAGDALLAAKSWDVAQQAFDKSIELAQQGTNEQTSVVGRATLGKAKTLFGANRLAEAHEAIEAFIGNDKFSRSALVVDAYMMLIEVASEEGRTEKDDALRMKYFNAAVGAIKKVRKFRPEPEQQAELDLQSGDVLVRKMDAEDAMGLKDAAKETCARAAVTFQAYLMAHEPSPEHPVSKMTPRELVNLERCYSTALPLMARLGKEQSENVLKYGAAYLEHFPDGKHKTAVQNAMNQAKADK